MAVRAADQLDDTVPAIEAGFHAAGQAIWAWLHDDAVAAQAAAELVAGTITDRWLHVSNHAPAGVPLWAGSYKMIMRTDPAVGVAIALSYAGDRWDPSFRSDIADKLLILAEELLRGGVKAGPIASFRTGMPTRARPSACAPWPCRV